MKKSNWSGVLLSENLFVPIVCLWVYVLTRLLSSAFLVTCNFVLARQWVFGVGTAEPPLTLVSTPDPASAD